MTQDFGDVPIEPQDTEAPQPDPGNSGPDIWAEPLPDVHVQQALNRLRYETGLVDL